MQLVGLANCTPLSKPRWGSCFPCREGFGSSVPDTPACHPGTLLVPEATEYSQSRQSPVFALGPCALENIGNQSELGYKAVLLKLPLGGTGW